MPVPAIGQVAPLVGRPHHHVGDARPDLVVTTGAPVRLHCSGDRDVANQPGSVSGRHHPVDATPGTLLIETGHLIPTVVTAWHHPSVGRPER
jgi:hypothetical protein